MKKYLGVLTALLCSASWFSSCELNEMNDVTFSGMQYSEQTKSIEIIPDTIELKYIYKGDSFISEALLYDDYMDILDPEVKEQYQNIWDRNLPGLLRHDDFVEYFDNEADLRISLKALFNGTRMDNYRPGIVDDNDDETDDFSYNPENYLARAFLYDDINFQDRKFPMYITHQDANEPVSIPNLKAESNFNDKTSSIKIHYYGSSATKCALLIVYENDTYNEYDSGHAIYMYANIYAREYFHRDLRALSVNTKLSPTSRSSWNDRISSCKFYICDINNLPNL